MTITRTQTEQSLLTALLFQAQNNEDIKKARKRRHVLMAIAFACFVFYTYSNDSYIIAGVYGVVLLLIIFLYPRYSAWLYKRHYKKHIAKNHQQNIGNDYEITFYKDHITITEQSAQSKIGHSRIASFNFVPGYLLIRMNDSSVMAIAEAEGEEWALVREHVQAIGTKTGIPVVELPGWRWK